MNGQIRCSSCELICGGASISKSQMKKAPELRRCISCVMANNSSPTKATSSIHVVEQRMQLTSQNVPCIKNPNSRSILASPLQKSLTLCKANGVDNKSKKRKLEMVDKESTRFVPNELVSKGPITVTEPSSPGIIENDSENNESNKERMLNIYSKLKHFFQGKFPTHSKYEIRNAVNQVLDDYRDNEEELFTKISEISIETSKEKKINARLAEEGEDNKKTETPKKKKIKARLAEEDEENKTETPKKKKIKARLAEEENDLSEKSKESKLTAVVSSKAPKCDKCDGNHATELCPHFKKARDKHPDAQKRKAGADIGGAGGNVRIKRGTVVSQPGDGSCLFHSMSYGLKRLGIQAGGARILRRDIAAFLMSHPNTQISDTPVSRWVKWDSGMNVQKYCQRMSRGGWGGGIELAGCSLLKRVNIHVYERLRGGGGLKRISCFNCPDAGVENTIYVLYCGGMHYDGLFLDASDIQRIAILDKTPPSQKRLNSNHNNVDESFSSYSKKRNINEMNSNQNMHDRQLSQSPNHSSRSSQQKKQKFGLSANMKMVQGGIGYTHDKKNKGGKGRRR